MKISKSLLKRIISWLLYICLAAASFIFVHQTIQEYHDGKTIFRTSMSRVSSKDIPTLTICFLHKKPLEYNKHFQMSFVKSTFEYLEMSEGHNSITNGKGATHHLMLQNMMVRQTLIEVYRSRSPLELVRIT